MAMLFLFCALLGGTVLVCQFLLTLAGLGGHDVDIADSAGHDIADVPHDLSGDAHDLSGDAAHEMGTDHDHGGDGHDASHDQQHISTWLFGVLTFRTLVAATTFFGIGGMAARAAELSVPNQVLIAAACGVAALYLVHWLMRAFYRLGEDDTVRISRAIGQEGTVYVPIPGGKVGPGKIHLKLQGRLMEYAAVTAAKAPLPTGARVVVVAVAGAGMLEVQPLP